MEPRTHEFERARKHNLENVGVDIPRDALVVFTEASGLGKSSLVRHAVAEVQRRYGSRGCRGVA